MPAGILSETTSGFHRETLFRFPLGNLFWIPTRVLSEIPLATFGIPSDVFMTFFTELLEELTMKFLKEFIQQFFNKFLYQLSTPGKGTTL